MITLHTGVFALALAVIPVSYANDTAAVLAAGGLVPVKSGSVVMESEKLQISPHLIRVQYVFRNTSEKDVSTVVAFPLPEIDGGDLANIEIHIPSKDPLNFVDFHVSVDGRAVTPQAEVRAYFYGVEITSELRSLGLPLSTLDRAGVTEVLRKLSAADRSRLEAKQWVANGWPLWQSRIQFYWTQRFPAKRNVKVEHTYRPVVGGGRIYANDNGAANIAPYCGGDDALSRVKQLMALHAVSDGDPVLVEKQIEYLLTTGNNWSGPIRNFHLSIEADHPEDILLTCMPGVKQVVPMRYELLRSNFRPDRELAILILTPAGDAGAPRGPGRGTPH